MIGEIVPLGDGGGVEGYSSLLAVLADFFGIAFAASEKYITSA